MSVHVFGDSHSHYIFARCSGVSVHWMGPWTMHRVGRDGAGFVADLAKPEDGDVIIFVFGEIDVRCHLVRIAKEQARDLDALIGTLVDAYLAAIGALRASLQSQPRLIVLGTVPQMSAIVPNMVTPTYGSLRERTVARRKLNAALRKKCRALGLGYVDIPRRYQSFDGSMRMSLSDGHAHIAKDHAHHVCKRIGRAIGSKLAFRRPGLPARIRWMLARRSAVRRRDAASLWVLGENEDDAVR